MGLIARAPFKPQKRDYIEHHEPGNATLSVRPGDIVLTHGNHFFSYLIRFGQRMRYRGADQDYAYWNHVAIGVDEGTTLVEALGSGIMETDLSTYDNYEYVVVHVTASPESRQQMVAYLDWVAELGIEYNWGLIIIVALELLTGGRLSINLDGSEICSTLAAEALKSAGYRFNRRNVTPADLAWYFSVYSP